MEMLAEGVVTCPWCGESFSISVDTSQGGYSTIEDCTVCCRPIELTIECNPGELVAIEALRG
jgi:hypothetical protein